MHSFGQRKFNAVEVTGLKGGFDPIRFVCLGSSDFYAQLSHTNMNGLRCTNTDIDAPDLEGQ